MHMDESNSQIGTSQLHSERHMGTILVADDHEANREMLAEFISEMGYSPVLVADGREAVEHIRRDPPDLILCDIKMPGMDGYEVLKVIKVDEALRHLPVIMITAVDEIESAARCIELGADEYLPKPFNPTLLRARISAGLENKKLRDRERSLHHELAASYEALREAERIRDALAQMIVHDLNNPLTVLQIQRSLLERRMAIDGLSKVHLEHALTRIRQATEDMAMLINGILDVSKLETGQMPVSLSTVNGNQLLGSICSQYLLRAEAKDLYVVFSATDDDIQLLADEDLLRRVLQNLLNNAIKYAASATEIRASIRREETDIIFSVKDDGPGIAPEAKEKIFKKYFQAERKTTGERSGVGLGLAFCKMAIEAQGGAIWVESEEGQGATFHIKLPSV